MPAASEAVPIELDAAIASLGALIGPLALSVAGLGVDIELGDGVVTVVVSAGAVLLQPPSTRAAAATARPSGQVIRFVMGFSWVGFLASILRACAGHPGRHPNGRAVAADAECATARARPAIRRSA